MQLRCKGSSVVSVARYLEPITRNVVGLFRRQLDNKEDRIGETVLSASPIHQVLALAIRLPRHFIVRLNDTKSREFLRQIQRIETSCEIDEKSIDLPTVCAEIDRCVQEFAQSQTLQIDETLGTFAKALDELVDGLDKTVVDQGVRLVEIQKIKSVLGRVDGTSTLEEMKDVLSNGISEVSKLVDRELEIQRELRKVHERYKDRLKEDLGRPESELRIDPVTKIANRNGIERHFKAACDHARTNGSRYTFALVNLEGGCALSQKIGAEAADNALSAFAQRLQAAVGGAFIGRLGGDDFVVISSADATTVSRLLIRLGERLAVHPVGGIKQDPPIIPCCGIFEIEPTNMLDKLVSDGQAAIDRQRAIPKIA